MIYNLYFFRKTKIEKSIPFGHLIATPLSSSSLDHILEPLPHVLLLPSTKEVGRSPTVPQKVKGSKQINTRYLKDLIHKG